MSDWRELQTRLGLRVRENERLAPHTTFRIGGPADLYVRADTVDELVRFVLQAREYQAPFLVLGRGSNVLVADAGWRGLVIENHTEEFELGVQDEPRAELRVESGASLPGAASRTARQGWRGLEWAIGVPGTVGASIAGNAGAHGGCMADNVTQVEILNASGEREHVSNSDCAFVYRGSRFKRNGGREIILSARLQLARDDPTNCAARMNQYTEHRRRTQPTDPSVGSMFKNPPGDFAGRLIEAAGLKGAESGAIQVSTVHANFFVNRGGGTSRDVMNLIRRVQDQVRGAFGVELELEIELIG